MGTLAHSEGAAAAEVARLREELQAVCEERSVLLKKVQEDPTGHRSAMSAMDARLERARRECEEAVAAAQGEKVQAVRAQQLSEARCHELQGEVAALECARGAAEAGLKAARA